MTPKRLHPLALVMLIGGRLLTWTPLALLAFLRDFKGGFTRMEGLTDLGLLGILVAIAALSAGVRYWRFTYTLGPDALTVSSGLFKRRTSHIPYTKIQTLQRQQWFFLTPFGLERLSIETSGQDSDKAEAVLDAVPVQVAAQIEARRMRVAVAGATDVATGGSPDVTAAGPAEPAAPEAPISEPMPTTPDPAPLLTGAPDDSYTADAHALNLYALTSLGVIPIISGLLWVVNKLEDLAPKAWVDALGTTLSHLAVTLLVGLVILVLLIGFALSYFNLIQKYYRFTLTRRGDLLTAERGLLKRDAVSVQRPRIQAVRAKASILRQCFHLSTVQGLTASSAAADESDDDLVLLPVVADAALLPTMRPFIPWLPTDLPTLARPRTPWRYARNAALTWATIGLLAIAASWWWWRAWTPWVAGGAAALTLLAGPLGWLAGRHTGVVQLDGDRLVCQIGHVWSRETLFLRRANIQSLERKQPVWLARTGLGHLTINLRKGNGLASLDVKYLAQPTIAAVWAWYQPDA
ncbi:PH domain-containing protein [Lacticaseibacillus absianus]|uniref:PH domain-containing protein n=1 Tax=Lacticaseibacillus absianus TaxID=2729623 RepID=UPI0015CD0872|nr:PH domain-containing protein [Lacticaseibacillus absianus]